MAETTKWPDDATAVMRGMFNGLIHEAKIIQETVFDNLGSCDTCTHLFDRRDKRSRRFDKYEFCPACELEAQSKPE